MRWAGGIRAAATSACALIALAVPCVVAAQAEANVLLERQQRILQSVEEIQSREGQYSRALLEQLDALISLYRESGDQALALVAIARALQVVRANSGLYSLEQVPLLWQQIAIEEASGNDAAVWDLEQELLTLVRRHPNDLRAAQVLHEMADRQMAVLERVLDGETPPQVVLGCFYKTWAFDEGGSCYAGSRKTVVQGMLAEAQRNYADAIAVLLRNEEYASDELRALEMALLRGAELVRSEYEDERRGITGSRILTRDELPVPLVPLSNRAEIREPWRSRTAPIRELSDWDFPLSSTAAETNFLREYQPRERRLRDPYHRGRQSLRRLYAYGVAQGDRPVDRATAIVLLADWDLIFSHNGFALDGYELALEMLEDAGAPASSLEQLFSPSTPVVLPAFEPNPLARDDARPATGYIDAAFTITKYGRGVDVEIRGAANATDAAQDDLIGLIRGSRFRPRVTAGAFEASPVVVRYPLYD